MIRQGEPRSYKVSTNASLPPKLSKLSSSHLCGHTPLLASSRNSSAADHRSWSGSGGVAVGSHSLAAAVTDVGTFPPSDLLCELSVGSGLWVIPCQINAKKI